ncbi:Lar family restriction alleviation protein [Citrobacter sp. RHBSTW-00678]|uniref:Lar family restriction alleviation protein n=3 Tax=Citrobacter braakii TaxID=57706 RepID=A0AAD1L172_CITBR|nr:MULTISPECIES: Lar family restriction alleviation protein [Citrobacter]AUV26684.1 hypothetical protein C2U38_14215 [Citrobacter freundii complex sp. CFNIH3]MBA7758226.1 Lar family restriction alleviation protein [Citrobacter sp. RHBSTW-00325]MBA8058756.1 Lar family restriction alleviation protein [Citrobacter sp. RHBSTW-00104]QLR63237.1 Lar family restriction alleviation protein [Citrobacter sp. RHBSTW-00976]QLS34686.1 Lar family restriction alleviation protein [Citrobacter sp. RHBSTW-00903]
MTTNNHPAHGPVSLDRLHQIREILSKAAAQSDGGNLGYAMADAVKVIDGAIAAFGAKLDENGLLPCPLCGGGAEFDYDDDNLNWISCSACGISTDTVYHTDIDARDKLREVWNRRTAMLQAEPVSNSDELPLDYLQGHKDGLEWAAQLAEANHPQTGDWLYDDPIELARAIRKGPDIPEFKSVSVDEDDNFYSWFGRFWYENYQKNNYTTSAKQMLGTMAEFAYRAGRESAALAANSPVTPDDWQLVPKEPTEAMNKAGWAAINEHDAINPTYRAMLAAAPQQDVK